MISKDMHSIVYAVDYNHQREKQAPASSSSLFVVQCKLKVQSLLSIRHLNGFHFEAFQKPTLLVTDSKHIEQQDADIEQRNATFLCRACHITHTCHIIDASVAQRDCSADSSKRRTCVDPYRHSWTCLGTRSPDGRVLDQEQVITASRGKECN